MAVQSLGMRTVDFDTKAVLMFDQSQISQNDQHFFWLETTTPIVQTLAGYLNFKVVYESPLGEFITPLILKIFPGQIRTSFYFGIPRSGFGNNLDFVVIAQPKEFSPGLEEFRQFNVELFWDDDPTGGVSQIGPPGQ